MNDKKPCGHRQCACQLDLPCPLRVYLQMMKAGISRSKEFERKLLAPFTVTVGLKCGHSCLYCSTGAMVRTNEFFREADESPFDVGYAVVDPNTPDRVARDAARKRRRGMVILSHLTDAWSPEAQRYDLGRRCLEAILSESEWTVRILTKNAAVAEDFDIVEKYRDRVMIGVSITATPDSSDIIGIIEPNASPIHERMAVLKQASRLGLRTYAMFCPLLPGIADARRQIEHLVGFAVDVGAEEIFVEPVNLRGPNLQMVKRALEKHGYQAEAAAVDAIRHKQGWSAYAAELLSTVQQSVRSVWDIRRLRFLLYTSRLLPLYRACVERDCAGVVMLGKRAS